MALDVDRSYPVFIPQTKKEKDRAEWERIRARSSVIRNRRDKNIDMKATCEVMNMLGLENESEHLPGKPSRKRWNSGKTTPKKKVD